MGLRVNDKFRSKGFCLSKKGFGTHPEALYGDYLGTVLRLVGNQAVRSRVWG